MKRFITLAAMMLFCGSAVATEEFDERQNLVDTILELQNATYVGDEYTQFLIDRLRDQLISAGIELDLDFYGVLVAAIEDAVHQELVMSGELEDLLTSDLEFFDTRELKELVEFYKTPLGGKLLAWSPELVKMNLLRASMLEQRVGLKIQEQLQVRLSEGDFDLDELRPAVGPAADEYEEGTLLELIEQKCSESGASKARLPVHRGPPTYPIIARSFEIEGWVDLSFVIKPDGRLKNLKVMKNSAGTIFDKAALSAAREYRYCPGTADESASIRIRFEMEKNANSASKNERINKPKNLKENSIFAFATDEFFNSDFQKYGSSPGRKAYAIASDGGERWVRHWYTNYRTQEEANEKALQECFKSRIRRKIKSDCQLLMIGNDLGSDFHGSQKLQALSNALGEKEYQKESNFELAMADYRGKLLAKSMAITENPDGAYYYYFASGWETQDQANTEALAQCEKEKSDDFLNDCRLYMVDNYKAEEIPMLNSMKGIWQGEMNDRTTGLPSEESPDVSFKLRFENCEEHPKFYMLGAENPEFTQLHRIFEIAENTGNAVLSSVENGGDWVETQVWTFIELSAEQVVVQRNRMVSNVGLELDEELRNFGALGMGSLSKLSECEAAN